jgi:hypothetical protein
VYEERWNSKLGRNRLEVFMVMQIQVVFFWVDAM